MRDKFSDLINQGIAPARYQDFTKEEPSSLASIDDNMIITYNNYWGVITDTHMSRKGDDIVITGSLLRSEHKTNRLMDSGLWGDIQLDRIVSGVYNLSGFLNAYGYTWYRDILNGDWVVKIVPAENEKVAQVATSESLNEANTKVTFDLRSDVYNVLAELAYEYNKKNKNHLLNKDAMEDALESFMDKFYEEYDED